MVGNEAQSEPVGHFIYFFFVRDEIVLVAVVGGGGGNEGGWRKGGILPRWDLRLCVFSFFLIHWFWGGAVVMVGRRDAGNG